MSVLACHWGQPAREPWETQGHAKQAKEHTKDTLEEVAEAVLRGTLLLQLWQAALRRVNEVTAGLVSLAQRCSSSLLDGA